MRFGQTLKKSIHPPWKDHYIDYNKLKTLLRENYSARRDDDLASSWTEDDEETFVQELINVQLDKVNAFQVDTYKGLRDRMAACEAKLEPLVTAKQKNKERENRGEAQSPAVKDPNEKRKIAEEALRELDSISAEVTLLEKYCRINFTGFLKAAKKHDRKRGTFYKVRPLLQVRLAELPFDSEDYSPFLYRLSTMYAFARQTLGELPSPSTRDGLTQDQHVHVQECQHTYSSYKFWVHLDNLLEVKTLILRKLPVLVYSPDITSRDMDMALTDPSFTSLYFDSPRFKHYNQRVDRGRGSTLRLWWRGFLAENPQIFLEYITTGQDDRISGEVRVPLKEKHIKSFLAGDYHLEKQIENMNLTDSARADALQKSIADLQRVIKEDELQPVLRTTYNRTAFQIPGDDRVRVSLDTDLAFIREDALDQDRPCRDPEDWHRQDIDNRHMNFPFSEIRQGEISRFPHALLEIRIRDDAKKGSKELLSDLLNSHLVKESPRFSKFVHGVAELFEDYVNSFPFWLSDLDTDIRRDPEDVDANDERERKRNEDHFAVGSFIGSLRDNYRPPGSSHAAAFDESRRIFRSRESVVLSKADAERLRKQSIGQDSAISDQGEAIPSPRFAPTTTTVAAFGAGELNAPANERQVDTGIEDRRTTIAPFAGLRTYFARLRARRRDDSAPLPPGVQVPGTWIKDAGPLRVEAKVWLANQRTFIKWQHIAVLLASLSVGLYNAAMTRNDQLATVLALVYVSFAVFAGAWGYSVYLWRSNLIRKRSGKDFDNVAGPMIVCLGLAIALLMNFWLKYSEYQRARENKPGSDPLPVPDKPIWAFNASGHVSGPVEDDFMLVNQAVN